MIDTGVARISRYSHRSRLQRLPIEKISQASANQRSGRCGRVGPGIAIRLYSEEDFLARPEFTEPEIQRTNLAAVILQMHALKLGDIEAFPFVEPPDGRYVRDGQRTLRELGALSDEGQLTEIGRRLAELPLDPRLGRILLAGAEEHCLEEVAIIASALSVPDPRDRPADKQTQADQKHAPLRDEQSDFLSLLKLWRVFERAARTALARQAARLVQGELPLLPAAHRMARRARPGHGGGERRARAQAQYAAGRVRVYPPRLARGPAVAGRAAQGAGRVSGRQRHEACDPSGIGPVQGAARVDRQRRAGADHQGLRAQRRAHRSRVGRSRSARTWSSASTTSRTGSGARRAPRSTNARRCSGSRCRRAAACPTKRSTRRPRASCSSGTRWCSWNTTRARRSSRTTSSCSKRPSTCSRRDAASTCSATSSSSTRSSTRACRKAFRPARRSSAGVARPKKKESEAAVAHRA